MGSLMNAIQQEIDCARLKTRELVADGAGSITQTVVTEVASVPNVAKDESKCLMIARYALDISGSHVVATKSLRCLQRHVTEDRTLNTWSI